MNKLRNIILVMVIALFANSCAEPAEPDPIQVVVGEWRVENVIANGQVNLPEIFEVDSRLHLDHNQTFLFVNVDGRATAGSWTATETNLMLENTEGSVQDFTIVYLNWEKMHVYRTFTIDMGNEIELRYMFRRD